MTDQDINSKYHTLDLGAQLASTNRTGGEHSIAQIAVNDTNNHIYLTTNQGGHAFAQA